MARNKGDKKKGRLAQIREAYRMTKQGDPKVGWILLGTFVGVAAVAYALFFLIPPDTLVLDILIALMCGLLGVLIIFGRRATKSQVTQLEGKPGASVAVLSILRRGWKTEPMVAFNKNQDVVHRVVGPPGIVLIGEGNPNRLRTLLAAERTKHQRVVSETPIHEVIIGFGEGEVPLGRLVKHVRKLGRNIKPAEMTDVLQRLKALDATRLNIPMPKGPVPTSMKGNRGNLRGR